MRDRDRIRDITEDEEDATMGEHAQEGSDRHAPGAVPSRGPWPSRLATVLLAAMVVGCGGLGESVGDMGCDEFMDLSQAERTDVFLEAIDDRGLSLQGPDFTVDMQRATAESHCMNRPSDTLDDGVDAAGIPRT